VAPPDWPVVLLAPDALVAVFFFVDLSLLAVLDPIEVPDVLLLSLFAPLRDDVLLSLVGEGLFSEFGPMLEFDDIVPELDIDVLPVADGVELAPFSVVLLPRLALPAAPGLPSLAPVPPLVVEPAVDGAL
jgi:hypothetical protein